MPLLPVYYTTTKYSRRKKKVNPQKYETEWRKHNKFLKRMQLSPITLQEYVDGCFGKVKKSTKVDTWKPDPVFRRPVEYIPSHGVKGVPDSSFKRTEEYKYQVSQNYIIGQAYNKGGWQVLSRAEADDPNTGKRR
jgi:hypothetical protein